MDNYAVTPYSSEETKRVRGRSYEDELSRILNNFFLRFPLGNEPNETKSYQGLYRNSIKDWDVIGYDFFSNPEWHSTKRLGQTHKEFFDELDKTVQELGIPMERVSEAINAYARSPAWDQDKRASRCRKMFHLLLPIFISMRKKGYSRHDLIG